MWQFSPNSIHYLLGLWQRMVCSTPYIKATEPHLLETYTPEVRHVTFVLDYPKFLPAFLYNQYLLYGWNHPSIRTCGAWFLCVLYNPCFQCVICWFLDNKGIHNVQIRQRSSCYKVLGFFEFRASLLMVHQKFDLSRDVGYHSKLKPYAIF